jgi:hypothetical protein
MYQANGLEAYLTGFMANFFCPSSMELAIATWVGTACKQKFRQQMAYNGTNMVTVFSYSTDDVWDVNLNYVNDGKYCTSRYFEGGVHCGFLESAWARAAMFIQPGIEDIRDVCYPFLRRSCPTKLVWTFGGFSQGSAVMPIWLMLVDGLLRDAYGIDWLSSMKECHVKLWGPIAMGDAKFINSYKKRFGPYTTTIVHNADALFASSGFLLKHVDSNAIVQTKSGFCGVGENKKLHECLPDCDPTDSSSYLGCVNGLFAALSSNVVDQHLSTINGMSETGLDGDSDGEVTSYPLQMLAFLARGVERVGLATADIVRPNDRCIEESYTSRQQHFASVCHKEIKDDPWGEHAMAAFASTTKTTLTKWCAGIRMRLLQRKQQDALDEFDTICCETKNDVYTNDNFVTVDTQYAVRPFIPDV